MKLKKLKLTNIRSYKSQEIIFPEGSTLLAGDIGSGKTSILLAIEYAFFGLQPGQRGTSLLSGNEDEGEIILELEVDGNEIIIERKLKRGSKTVNQDYSAISINGNKIESSITELKTKILDILNYPQEFLKKTNILYRYTVYCPQEEMKQIILDDSESRLNVLRHIFGIEKYKKIRENLLTLSSKLREDSRLLQIEVKDIDDMKLRLDNYKKSNSLVGEKIVLKQKDLKDKISERKLVEEAVKKIESEIKEKERLKKEIEKTKILLSTKLEKLSSESKNISELDKKIHETAYLFDQNKFNLIVEQIKEKRHNIEELHKNYIETSTKINTSNLKKVELLEKRNRISKIDICPTCLQAVTSIYKTNILNDTSSTLNSIDSDIKSLTISLTNLNKNLTNDKNLISELENKKAELSIVKIKAEEAVYSKEKLEELKKSQNALKKDIEFLEAHSDSLKEAVLGYSKFDNLYKIKQDELKKSFQTEKRVEIELAELNKEVEIVKKEIESLQKTIKDKEQIREKMFKIISLEKWLSEDFLNLISFIERNIMIKIREEFSHLFNKWFAILTNDSFYVHLDENFTPIIIQKEFELDYSFLSGGERTAVALAYRLALNQIINSVFSRIKTKDLIILDEPTDGFSDLQLDKMRDILQEINVNQLILVSHEQKVESFVDNVLRLKKEAGYTVLDETNPK